MTPGIWGSPTFTPGSFRNVDSLVEKLRAKADAVSSFLHEQMDPATKECVDLYQPPSGDSKRLRAIVADHFNKVISGDSICDIPGFQTVRLKPETQRLRSQNPQGKDRILLNRLIIEGVYYEELWWNRNWQPNAELCHPSHGLQIDRFEIIHDSKFAHIATEIANQISFVSPFTTVQYHTIDWEDPWDFEEVYVALDDWVEGYHFDVDNECYMVHMVKGSDTQKVCMFALVESRHIPGILVHNSPPEEATPHGEVSLVDLDLAKYDRIAARFQLRQKAAELDLKMNIPTRNAGFNQLIARIEKVAESTTSPILLLGPPGAGKSNLAERIHNTRKKRRLVSGEFKAVDCATIRGDQAMSALFGHVKGAFTGATEDRQGALLEADKGSLLLDEIANLEMREQGLLLRALETKTVVPLGGGEKHAKKSDFRLISATNQDLEDAVRRGVFRADLFSRIKTWTFHLPGLQERPEDVEPNFDHELDCWEQKNGKRVRMSKEVREKYLRFATSPEAKWPGNFRELIDSVERMATFRENGAITPVVVEDEINLLKKSWSGADASGEGSDAMLRSLMGEDRLAKLDLIDRIQLSGVIQVCRECRSAAEAARRLYLERTTNDSDRVTKYLKHFGLHFLDIKGLR